MIALQTCFSCAHVWDAAACTQTMPASVNDNVHCDFRVKCFPSLASQIIVWFARGLARLLLFNFWSGDLYAV